MRVAVESNQRSKGARTVRNDVRPTQRKRDAGFCTEGNHKVIFCSAVPRADRMSYLRIPEAGIIAYSAGVASVERAWRLDVVPRLT